MLQEKRIVAICDSEMDYACRLMEYLRERIPDEVHVYSSWDKLPGLDHDRVDLLLISETSYETMLQQTDQELPPLPPFVILCEKETYLGESVQGISKYQAAGQILAVVQEKCGDRQETGSSLRHKPPIRILGSFQIQPSYLQTAVLFGLGQLLSAGEGKILYLSARPFPGLRDLIGADCPCSLEQILYYSECAPDKLGARLADSVYECSGLDVAPQIRNYEELFNITGEQWNRLVQRISQMTDYDVLLLDLDLMTRGLFDLLRSCDDILMMEEKGPDAVARMREMEAWAGSPGYQDVFARILHLEIPSRIRELPPLPRASRGEFGHFVRRVLEEEIHGL